MTGTLTKRAAKNGRFSWGYIYDSGRNEAGKRVQTAKSGFGTKSQAADALRAAIAETEARASATEVGPTKPDEVAPIFAVYFEYWLTNHAARRCAPKTLFRYRELGAYLIKDLGETRIDKLTTAQIQKTIHRLEDSGGMISKAFPGGRPLAAKTVRSIGGVLYTCLAEADRLDMLKIRHPMEGKRVKLPKLRKRDPAVLDEAKLGLLFESARGTRIFPFIVMAAASGCRRGELLALTWADFNPSTGEVKVSKSLEQLNHGRLRVKETKSEKPRRFTVPEWAMEVLEQHRIEQQRDRDLYGGGYGNHDLIFCTPEGEYYSPDREGARVVELMRKAGLAGVSLHSLRHSHASSLLSKGVPLAVVSERLGHADQNITLGIYSHALPADSNAAAKVWNDAMADVIAVARKPAAPRMLAIVSKKIRKIG
jgi:integrase